MPTLAPSSIRPPATDEAEKLTELDQNANSGEDTEERLEREAEQRQLYNDHVAKARKAAADADEEDRVSTAEALAEVTFSPPIKGQLPPSAEANAANDQGRDSYEEE